MRTHTPARGPDGARPRPTATASALGARRPVARCAEPHQAAACRVRAIRRRPPPSWRAVLAALVRAFRQRCRPLKSGASARHLGQPAKRESGTRSSRMRQQWLAGAHGPSHATGQASGQPQGRSRSARPCGPTGGSCMPRSHGGTVHWRLAGSLAAGPMQTRRSVRAGQRPCQGRAP